MDGAYLSAQYNIADILDVTNPLKPTRNKSGYSFDKLKSNYQLLTNLNKVLYTILPNNIHSHAHIGAIDELNNTLIIFVDSASVVIKLKEFSQAIMREIAKHNYNYNNIMFKTKVNVDKQFKAEDSLRILDAKTKQKLLVLATQIGKPELVIDSLPELKSKAEIEIVI